MGKWVTNEVVHGRLTDAYEKASFALSHIKELNDQLLGNVCEALEMSDALFQEFVQDTLEKKDNLIQSVCSVDVFDSGFPKRLQLSCQDQRKDVLEQIVDWQRNLADIQWSLKPESQRVITDADIARSQRLLQDSTQGRLHLTDELERQCTQLETVWKAIQLAGLRPAGTPAPLVPPSPIIAARAQQKQAQLQHQQQLQQSQAGRSGSQGKPQDQQQQEHGDLPAQQDDDSPPRLVLTEAASVTPAKQAPADTASHADSQQPRSSQGRSASAGRVPSSPSTVATTPHAHGSHAGHAVRFADASSVSEPAKHAPAAKSRVAASPSRTRTPTGTAGVGVGTAVRAQSPSPRVPAPQPSQQQQQQQQQHVESQEHPAEPQQEAQQQPDQLPVQPKAPQTVATKEQPKPLRMASPARARTPTSTRTHPTPSSRTGTPTRGGDGRARTPIPVNTAPLPRVATLATRARTPSLDSSYSSLDVSRSSTPTLSLQRSASPQKSYHMAYKRSSSPAGAGRASPSRLQSATAALSGSTLSVPRTPARSGVATKSKQQQQQSQSGQQHADGGNLTDALNAYERKADAEEGALVDALSWIDEKINRLRNMARTAMQTNAAAVSSGAGGFVSERVIRPSARASDMSHSGAPAATLHVHYSRSGDGESMQAGMHVAVSPGRVSTVQSSPLRMDALSSTFAATTPGLSRSQLDTTGHYAGASHAYPQHDTGATIAGPYEGRLSISQQFRATARASLDETIAASFDPIEEESRRLYPQTAGVRSSVRPAQDTASRVLSDSRAVLLAHEAGSVDRAAMIHARATQLLSPSATTAAASPVSSVPTAPGGHSSASPSRFAGMSDGTASVTAAAVASLRERLSELNRSMQVAQQVVERGQGRG